MLQSVVGPYPVQYRTERNQEAGVAVHLFDAEQIIQIIVGENCR